MDFSIKEFSKMEFSFMGSLFPEIFFQGFFFHGNFFSWNFPFHGINFFPGIFGFMEFSFHGICFHSIFFLKFSFMKKIFTENSCSPQNICYLPADFFSFLLNFKCRHWRFICFTASKEKRDPMIEQHLNQENKEFFFLACCKLGKQGIFFPSTLGKQGIFFPSTLENKIFIFQLQLFS